MENLTNKLRQFRDERNWQKFHTSKDLAISVSVEAAELLELFQWRDTSKPADGEFIEHARNEVADVFLYLLMFCDTLGIDLETAAEEKIEKNRRRFPVESSHSVAKPIDRSGEK